MHITDGAFLFVVAYSAAEGKKNSLDKDYVITIISHKSGLHGFKFVSRYMYISKWHSDKL